MIYTKNKLLDIARQPIIPDWAKELCYRTLKKGVLGEADIQQVFDIFASNSAPITPVPGESPKQTLRLLSMAHKKGVNALKNDTEIVFCEEGMTILYGQNATGKSGYFRVLEHLAGGQLATSVLQNIYVEHPETPLCKIKYSINDTLQPEYTWDNTDATKGNFPFSNIAVFSSKYAEHLLRRHRPDTYILDMYGLVSINQFKQNFEKFMDKVAAERSDREDEVLLKELLNPGYDSALVEYLSAIRNQLQDNIERLLEKKVGIQVELQQNGETPELVIKLDKPYAVDAILSEGEQKAIALALLITDAEIRVDKNPIIFDDPVNSLDNKIIYSLVEKLSELENQIILFSHNVWFVEQILASQSYKPYSCKSLRADRGSTHKHVIAYQVTSSAPTKGDISEYEIGNAQFYLDAAKSLIDTVPFTKRESESAQANLRKAVQCLVDEKIFKGLTPCKYHLQRQNIEWAKFIELKSIAEDTIKILKAQYDKLSSRGLHLGMAAREDSLEHDDLDNIYNKLVAL